MKKSLSSLINTRGMAPAVLGALASVLFVAAITWAATTINNNVNTGGTLTVSGASTLTGTTTLGAIYASSTVFVDGDLVNTRNAIFGTASQTPAVTGLNVTGNVYFTGGLGVGIATTSGLAVSGMGTFNSAIDVRSGTSTITGAAVGFMGSSTPYLEVGIAGDVAVGGALGTSTVSVDSSTANRGGCIELKGGTDGLWIRMYAGAVGTTTGSNGVVQAGASGLIVQQGRCQTGNE